MFFTVFISPKTRFSSHKYASIRRSEEEKGATEDKMVGWHHRFNGHEFEQTLGDSEGQGSLACRSPWGHKELDTTEQLNNNQPFQHMNTYLKMNQY